MIEIEQTENHWIYKIPFFSSKKKIKFALKQELIFSLINHKLLKIDFEHWPKKSERLQLKQVKCMEIFNLFKKVCEEHNVQYWLFGGTLLGAYRHKGFIPWDLDMDVQMLREDFIKVIPYIKEAFKDTEYIVREVWQDHFQLRIKTHDNIIGLDIFPVDKYYKETLTGEEKKALYEKINNTADMLIAKVNEDKNFGKNIDEARSYINKIIQENILENKPVSVEKPILFCGVDLKQESLPIYNWDDIYPLDKLEFEGIQVPVPKNYKKCMILKYGDYMKLPKANFYNTKYDYNM